MMKIDSRQIVAEWLPTGEWRLPHRRVISALLLCWVRLWDCMSVPLSVTIRFRDQIGWNSSKIISWPNSLRLMSSLTPNVGEWRSQVIGLPIHSGRTMYNFSILNGRRRL